MLYKIPMVVNAIDELKAGHMYLESFIDFRKDEFVPEIETLFAIKHTIKHLASCWELLMKFRIQQHDPLAIFENPNKITNEKLKTGNFHTINYSLAISYLNQKGIDIAFPKLTMLRHYRNRIEHFEIEEPFDVLIQTLVDAIDELIHFCSCYITPLIQEKDLMYETGDIVIELFGLKNEVTKLLDTGAFSEE